MNLASLASLALGGFMALGGITLLLHAAAKLAPKQLKKGIILVMNKYPTLKRFVAEHADDLKAIAQALEKAEEEAIDAARSEEPPRP